MLFGQSLKIPWLPLILWIAGTVYLRINQETTLALPLLLESLPISQFPIDIVLHSQYGRVVWLIQASMISFAGTVARYIQAQPQVPYTIWDNCRYGILYKTWHDLKRFSKECTWCHLSITIVFRQSSLSWISSSSLIHTAYFALMVEPIVLNNDSLWEWTLFISSKHFSWYSRNNFPEWRESETDWDFHLWHDSTFPRL